MMKYIMFGIKMIPVITILQGVISGGSRMGPLMDTVQVAITQYEIAQISQILVETKGPMVTPDKFSDFVREHYYSQYSVLFRELKGDREHDHAIDIWGKPFQLIPIEGSGVKVVSAGPDGQIENKDDLVVTIEGASPTKNSLASAQKKQKKKAQVPAVENQANINDDQQNSDHHNLPIESEEHRVPASAGEFDEEGYDQEGYDQSGFNRDGHNRDGYDVNENQPPEE